MATPETGIQLTGLTELLAGAVEYSTARADGVSSSTASAKGLATVDGAANVIV